MPAPVRRRQPMPWWGALIIALCFFYALVVQPILWFREAATEIGKPKPTPLTRPGRLMACGTCNGTGLERDYKEVRFAKFKECWSCAGRGTVLVVPSRPAAKE